MTLPIPFKCVQVHHLPGDRVTGTASTGAIITGKVVEYLAHVVDEKSNGINGYFRSEDLKAAPNRRRLPDRRVWQQWDTRYGRRITSSKSGRRWTDPEWSDYISPPDRRKTNTPRRQWQSIDSHCRRTLQRVGRRHTDIPGDHFYYSDRRKATNRRRVQQVLAAPIRRGATPGRRVDDACAIFGTFYYSWGAQPTSHTERRVSQRRIEQNRDYPTFKRKNVNGTGRRVSDPKKGWHTGNGYYYQ